MALGMETSLRGRAARSLSLEGLSDWRVGFCAGAPVRWAAR